MKPYHASTSHGAGRQLAADVPAPLWAVAAGSSAGGWLGSALAAAAQADGSTIVTGNFLGTASFGAAGNVTSAGGNDGFVGKLTSSGDWAWVTQFGGTASDYGYGIAAQAGGSTLVTGTFEGTASFGAVGNVTSGGFSDGFVGKVTSSGDWAWVTQIGGQWRETSLGIATQADGSGLVTGYFWNTASFGAAGSLTSVGSGDGFVGKLTSSGDWAWVTQLGGAAFDSGAGIASQADGSTLVT